MIVYPTQLREDDFLRVVWRPENPLYLTFEKKIEGQWLMLSTHWLSPIPTGMKELHQVMDDYYYHGMVMVAEDALAKAS